tara:strand:- start:986 stop:1774 length:789 start_codon:yes stop_codon:yes gene_type:complete
MGRSRTQERINLSQSVLSRKQERLKRLKIKLANVIEQRTNMSENYLSIGSETKYKQLNDRIAKLNFEIMVMEGGTIKDNHVAEWINENRWKYQNPYTGEVRDFKVGDRFNLDYGGKVDLERKDWKTPSAGLWGYNRHGNWVADPNDLENYQTFELEKIKNSIESLQISRVGENKIYQLEGESDELFALRKQAYSDQVYVVDGKIVKNNQPGATKMLRSDYLRETDLDSFRTEHNIITNDLIESLKINNNEAKRDLSITNGTQ